MAATIPRKTACCCTCPLYPPPRTLDDESEASSLRQSLIPKDDHQSDHEQKEGKAKGRNWFWQLYVVICFVWPRKNGLQLRVFVSLIVVLLGRGVNLATPIVYKNMVDTIAGVSDGELLLV